MTIPPDHIQAPSGSNFPPIGSNVPPEVAESIEWLVQEQGESELREQKAILYHEAAQIRESVQDEAGAARDYLAAHNADPGFREPVEALTALLQRRKSFKNLSRLLEAMKDAATDAEELARAHLMYGQFALEQKLDVDGARAAFEQATAEHPDEAAAWLELELVAGKTGDVDLRLRALEERVRLAEPAEWKALLLVDLARAREEREDLDGALDLLRQAREIDSPARFKALQAIESIARADKRDELLSDVLKAQADLVLQALDDGAAGDRNGVPLYVRTPVFVADLFVRAAEARRRMGDADGVTSTLDLALAKLPDDPALLHLRRKAAEAVGDVGTASMLAGRLLENGSTGRAAAALWMSVFEAAAASGRREDAIDALAKALSLDPGCIPARTLQLDLIIEADPAAFASSLEAMAEEGLSDKAKGRAYLLSAWAWAMRAKDVSGAKAALSQAAMFGVSPGVVSRLARAFASAIEDDVWFEDATRRLLAAGATEAEHASLWFELARMRLLRHDDEGARQALDAVAGAAGGLWLGRVLAAYALGLRGKGEAPKLEAGPLEQLAEADSDPTMARALRVTAAIRWARAGQADVALQRLRDLHQADLEDLLVMSMLADLERAVGRWSAAAEVLAASAAAQDDMQVAASLHLEAALLFWKADDKGRALEEMTAARAQVPAAATTLLMWALAQVDPDSLDARRRMLELGEECGVDRIGLALERVAVEATDGGDEDLAASALDTIERDALGELGVAGWLGRLVYPFESEDQEARSRALDGLETLGIKASAVVAAEKYRLARVQEQDRDKARDAAQAWALADGGLASAIEWMAAGRAADDAEAEVSALRLAARHLPDGASAALQSSATLVELLGSEPGRHPAPVESEHVSARLMNLELAPAGCDPRRRAWVLQGLGDALGEEARLDAMMLAGWSLLVAGDAQAALNVFGAVATSRPGDLVAWEGVRSAAEAVDDVRTLALACEKLGELCRNEARAAEFHETAALLWIDRVGDEDRGERNLRAAFDKDLRRFVAFDKLFRRVRARDDADGLLALIARRLEVAEDPAEIAKLFWEQARVLRQKGEFDGAMAALETVTMLEPDHVGALALAGEVYIRRGDFAQAVDHLARLVEHPEAPAQQRLVSGMAAVDLCENRLHDNKRALEVLLAMTRSGLTTLPVRERLARSAAQNQVWTEATAALESLMRERATSEGRIEAARLAMVIYRDKIGDPAGAAASVEQLLSEAPSDPEALDLLLSNPSVCTPASRERLLHRARRAIVDAVRPDRLSAASVELLARVAQGQGDSRLRQATLGALMALRPADAASLAELEALDARVARIPQVMLSEQAMEAINDPQDRGAIPRLMLLLAEAITDALGPTLVGLSVTKKDRIDARDGLPLRNEIAQWAGALGIGEFELYVGGRDPKGVAGVAGSPPVLVVGNQITAPLSPSARQAIARELYAIRRGISVVRTRDETTVAAIMVAACQLAKVPIQSPPYAILTEVSRLLSKSIPGKLKKVLPEYCQAVVASGADPIAWYHRAHASLDRVAAIAAGDVSLVLSDVLGVPRERLPQVSLENPRARELIAFVLSDRYLELRSQLGMGVR